jgi:3-phosphoshikimate 1-carboxyvinyltransferase
MEKLLLNPAKSISGTVTLPGSKSLSNRVLLLAALAKGTTKIQNILDSDDVSHMRHALGQLGVQITETAPQELSVVGVGGRFNAKESLELFLGNAGTAMRPLAAVLTVSQGEFILTGEPRMEERPIGDLVDSLLALGAKVEYLKNPGFPPLKIIGSDFGTSDTFSTQIRGNISSQFLTGLLMASPLLNKDFKIVVEGDLVSKPYIDITIDVMKKFGVVVENKNYQEFFVRGGQSYVSPGTSFVEGDASSASYFLAAAAIKGGTIRVYGVGTESIQGDAKFADVLEKMGAQVTWGPTWIEVTKGELNGIDIDLNHIPDAAMTIATAALFAKGPTAIRNVYNWRVKETDRLSAMATELRKVGALVVEGEDFIEITPPAQLIHAEIETYNDHRMAMCFSLVSLSDTPVTILDPKCTSKTFPNYFDVFLGLLK